jgi:hypothetical protein
MERKQGFLGRVVDIGAELFAMAAACVRVEMVRVDDAEQGEAAVELADARSATGPACGLMCCSTGCGARPATSTARS